MISVPKTRTLLRGIFTIPLLATTAVAVGCTADTGAEAQEASAALPSVAEAQEGPVAFPSDAVVLASIRPQAALEDPEVQEGLVRLASTFATDPGDTDDPVSRIEAATGVDLNAIREMTVYAAEDVFGDGPKDGARAAVFLEGAYDRANIVAALEREGAVLVTTTYGGQELIASDAGMAVAFLAEEVLVLGSPAGVRAAIDVRTGSAPPLSGDLLDSFAALGSPLVKLVAVVPAGALGKTLTDRAGGGLDAFPLDFTVLTGVRSLELTVDKAADGFALQATFEYPDAESAEEASDGLAGVIGFAKAFLAESELRDLLDKIAVGSSGARLDLAVEVGVDEAIDVLEMFRSFGLE